MVKTKDGTEIDETTLRELYKTSVEQYRYQHTDVWRGQQFYTTIDTTIIGIAVAVLKLGGSGGTTATILLFAVGIIVGFFGFLSVRKLRIYYLEALVHLALVEKLLHYHSDLDISEFEGRRKLAMHFTRTFHEPKESEKTLVEKPEKWIKANTYKWLGITGLFMLLQWAFIAMDATGIYVVWAHLA